jgi:hypothetical protein
MAGVIAPGFKAAKPFVSKFFGRVPILGPFIVGIVSLLSGEGVGKAIFKTLGTALGEFLGGALAAAFGVATVGIGALVAPSLVLLGGLLGSFLGDFLYDLFAGGGMGNAVKKLGGLVKGIFDKILDAGTAVKDWVTGGFGRFIETYKEENKLPKWMGGGTNWLGLTNLVTTLPLLVKSFFPRGDKKKSDAPSIIKKKMKSRRTKVGPTKYYIKGKEVSAEVAAPFVHAANEERINAVSKEASYEQTVIVPPVRVKQGDGEKTSAKALKITSGILLSQGGASTDAYEKLYVGGLA